MNKTIFLLMAHYDSPVVPVTTIAKDFLGLDARQAKRKALEGSLPFPTWRGPNAKNPWLVNVSDLAVWIDQQSNRARKDHATLQRQPHLQIN